MAQPTIGISVLDSLTTGMYVDCPIVFREYIQNAVDSINKAVIDNLIKKGGDIITVDIDKNKKKITITDNGTGISWSKSLKVLTDIANSGKKIGVDIGFRGIGRLGGIAYCDKLIFETSFKGEPKKSIITWDAKTLKELILKRDPDINAIDAVNMVTSAQYINEKQDSHYLTVKMEGVTNNKLLDVKGIREYLSMVAPIDIQTQFIYRNEIKTNQNNQHIKVDSYNIYVNGEQLYKPYSADIRVNKGQKDEVKNVDFFSAYDDREELLYWGWYTISARMERLGIENLARGIRIRKSNIQIGDWNICRNYFDEDRFASYYFGEIHAVHNNLIPNSRRDGFEENDTNTQFEEALKIDLEKLQKYCRDMSNVKSLIKTIEKPAQTKQEIKKKETKGFTSQDEQEKLASKIIEEEIKAEKAKKDLKKQINKMPADSPIKKVIEDTIKETTSNELETPTASEPQVPTVPVKTIPKYRTDQPIYSKFNKREKNIIRKIYMAIEQSMPNSDLRNDLIDKIEEIITK